MNDAIKGAQGKYFRAALLNLFGTLPLRAGMHFQVTGPKSARVSIVLNGMESQEVDIEALYSGKQTRILLSHTYAVEAWSVHPDNFSFHTLLNFIAQELDWP